MKTSTTQTVRLGIFVVTATLLFTAAVYLIGQKQNMFSETFRVHVLFNNVNGLQPGNNVRFSGINVGSVLAVQLINDSTIAVTLRIRESARPFIHSNSVATIGTDGLMGNMLVNISPGTGPGRLMNDSDTIQAFTLIKTDDILKTLNVTNENAAMLTRDLLDITQQIKHGRGAVSYVLYDTLLKREVYLTSRNLRVATSQANSLLEEFRALSAKARDGQGLAGWLLNDTLTQAKIESTVANLEALSMRLKSAGDSLQSAIDEARHGQGSLAVLLADTTAANDLRKTLHNLEEGTRKFDENMEALKAAPFIKKYFKEEKKKK
jgi:phospholipid/cholesterol/gamma-HCH transport system substrate-binding protein